MGLDVAGYRTMDARRRERRENLRHVATLELGVVDER